MKNSDHSSPEDAAAFVPQKLPDQRAQSTPLGKVFVGLLVSLVILGGALLLFTKTITISVSPAESRIKVLNGLAILNNNTLYGFAGQHTLEISADGYDTLEVPLYLNEASPPTFGVELNELPGLISFDLVGPETGQLFVNGESFGEIDRNPVEIERGTVRYRIEHPRYLPAEGSFEVSGFGQEQSVPVALTPNWRTVTLNSEPDNASVYQNEILLGQTPLTVDLMPDLYVLSFKKEGYAEAKQLLEIELGPPLAADQITLELLGGSLNVNSEPAGARVFVDGVYAGTSPLSYAAAADRKYEIRVEQEGYDRWTGSGSVTTGGTSNISASLVQQFGSLDINSRPQAVVFIDGEQKGPVPYEIRLPVDDYEVEIRLPGFRTISQQVQIKKNEAHKINAELLTEKDARHAEAQAMYRAPSGINMILAKPSAFKMGAPRGEPGQMANEIEKSISLERWFYIAETEVTYGHFDGFARDMAESIPTLGRISGSNPTHPVTQIDWQTAALFCNWLSTQQGLPHAYYPKNGKLVLDPSSIGYRLPTEAEWEWSARVAGRRSEPQHKYPWGNTANVPSGAGNFADTSTVASVPDRIPNYSDGFPGLAPVGSFSPNSMGIYDLGGNVAEWVHDYYGIELVLPGRKLVDPTGPENGLDHVVKGSSWRSGNETELRYSFRTYSDSPSDHIGFRIARWVH